MTATTTDLVRLRGALDDARSQGWADVDSVAAEMEEYVAAVRASRRGARVLADGDRRSTLAG
jgi:hypothetical protein